MFFTLVCLRTFVRILLPYCKSCCIPVVFFIVPDSVRGYILCYSESETSVFLFRLSVDFFGVSRVRLSVSPFSQPYFNTETFTLVSYPGMANHQSLLNMDLIRPW